MDLFRYGNCICSGVENGFVPTLIDLFEEDEREDGVRPQAEVVGGEALPEREEALVLHNLDGTGWERVNGRNGQFLTKTDTPGL